MGRPNVIWITLDSVRSDHTTIDGYRRDTTPELETIAAEGRGYRNCIAHGRSTLPSSGAILTGQAPSRTTLGITSDVLPKSIRTVAEHFSAAGYRTAALSGNSFVGVDTDLVRGFDRHQWLSSSTLLETGPRILLSYLLNIRKHSAGLTRDPSKHSSPYLMNSIVKQWIPDLAPDAPFFFYLHYNEPHRPYYPPLSYRRRYTDKIDQDPATAAETAMRIHRNLNEIIATGADLPDAEWEALEAMYDAEIAYTDHMIGRLYRWIQNQDLGETIFVVTADHGELFGEYGLLSHKYVLTDAVTRVPLVIAGLEDTLVPDGSDIIQHVDVMRTLLELAGAETEELLGYDLRSSRREFAISQRGPPNFEQILTHNAEWNSDRFHNGLLTALRTPEWRYQKSDDRAELFELPDEETDVSNADPKTAARLDDLLEDWFEKHGRPVAASRESEYSEATRRQLRELGYID